MGVRCPTCGAELHEGQVCLACHPKRDSTMDEVARKTGSVIEKGVKTTEKVIEELTPAARELADAGKKGFQKLKKATLDAARNLKEK